MVAVVVVCVDTVVAAFESTNSAVLLAVVSIARMVVLVSVELVRVVVLVSVVLVRVEVLVSVVLVSVNVVAPVPWLREATQATPMHARASESAIGAVKEFRHQGPGLVRKYAHCHSWQYGCWFAFLSVLPDSTSSTARCLVSLISF